MKYRTIVHILVGAILGTLATALAVWIMSLLGWN